ncbi:glycerophosphoryl diester phosphodiesterase [Plantibacter flavus]|uniref:glycerophosphodiester phosphodiesterase n=1 Tax=Plantibacter flavus TaxID=150123 RepID=A0A3N2C0G2_9MICO|nr:glycerophosphoryl diester phosphodiesterase [Plantibacter flavus]SMG06700.1 glycerophosphoryl diester phosphodiesterase [Plantibacter flavus]
MRIDSLPNPLVIGHRGAPGYRPEHTESSYRLAVALGADAVEPDLVASKDGVLVVRHENEISGTTDVAARPEFADRRTTKRVDGHELTGWFTEDFTWAELSTLTARERIPEVRMVSAGFDGTEGILRFADLVAVVRSAAGAHRRPVGIVAEVKHADYFASIGLPLDRLLAEELAALGFGTEPDAEPLIIESFEQSVLTALQARRVQAEFVYLIERSGRPSDLVARLGDAAPSYADAMTDAGLAALALEVDAISVDKAMLIDLGDDGGARPTDLVERAHAAGLRVYTWTLRPENRFLAPPFRDGADPAAVGRWLEEFVLVLSSGVDGCFVDQADLGVAARSAAGDRADHRDGAARPSDVGGSA